MTHTLHVVALPHTTLTEKDASCAYSMKVLKFVPMMQRLGHRVILYGPDEIECEPDEHVVIATEADRVRWGYGGNGYDTTTPFLWDAGQPYWLETNSRAIDALRERVDSRDFLLLTTSTQGPIADALSGTTRWNNPITVEWAVGYEGIDDRSFAAFESYCWQHHVYGLRGWRLGRAFDAVIPNFFDREQFPKTEAPQGDYLLFIGRLIERKGPHIAALLAERIGLPLVVAGPGAREVTPGKIVGEGVVIEGEVEYVGAVGFSARAELMGNASI